MPAFAQRNFGLDVLRGLAILLVMTHHLALPFRLPLFAGAGEQMLGRRVISALSYSGQWAVYLFFVLSGFLIARRCMEQYGELALIDWRSFYRQRAQRIVPLLAVLLGLLSVLHFLQVPYFEIKNPGQTWLGALTSAVFLHLNWYEGQSTWLPAAWDVLWSLSIEEVFYLAFPILCLWLPKRVLITLLLALAISLPWTRAALADNEIWQEKAYLPGFSAIAWGVLAAMLAQQMRGSAKFMQSLALIGTAALLLFWVFSGVLWSRWQDAALLFYCIVAGIAVIGASFAWQAAGPVSQKLFGWLSRLGQLSYELYLTHMLVLIPFVAVIQSYFAAQKFWWICSYPIAIALCFGLAKLAETSVSKPLARRWLSWPQHKLSPEKIPAAASDKRVV
jgi:peptidoglycan/LPS O-acetylase OafA/YrhL